MSSLPPRPAQRRQSSPQHSASAGNQDQANSDSPSTVSLDSQTVLLNEQSAHVVEEPANTTQAGEARKSSFKEDFQTKPPIEEPRKCWICFSDETEDTPESSVWKTPCPCALTAHEACLLDWVADMERSESSQMPLLRKEIRCPQCTSPIYLSRPKNYLVQSVSALEVALDRLRVPSFVVGLAYSFNIACYHHGLHTVRMIFGEDDAQTILAPLSESQMSLFERMVREHFPKAAGAFFHEWRGLTTELGLRLIPVALVGSRTNFADAVLPVMPILFFALQPQPPEAFVQTHWPPSAALTLIILPYLRSIYSEYLERVWAPREKQWMKEIQPSHSTTETGQARSGRRMSDHGEEELIELQMNLSIGIGDDAPNTNEQHNDGEAVPPDIARAQATQTDIEQDAAENVEALNQAADDLEGRFREEQERIRENQEEQGQEQENNVLIHASRAGDTLLGALLLPSISAAMGEGLRRLLPATITTPKLLHGRPVATGLLQTRWGRSIVGGCLFVVLKDAVRIYCRWKLAQSFRKRKIVNWNKTTGKFERA